MKNPIIPSAIALMFCVAARAAPVDDHGAAQLRGEWTLDLRPALDAPPYLKSMTLDVSAAGAVKGDFYDHAIEDGRAFAAKGRACFAFRTSDGSGPYQTAGCRTGDRIEGQTWSEGRRFLLTWSAVRRTGGE